MPRFWTMLAHYHGQTWNGAELARALAVSEPAVRRYLDALTDALVVRQLQPWFANASKRQVRSPKIYRDDLLGNPKAGASWDGFVIEQVLMMDDVTDPWFWGTHGGAELDLLVNVAGRRIGLEIKRTARPTVTPSIRSAMESLDLDHVIVVHGGLGSGVNIRVTPEAQSGPPR